MKIITPSVEIMRTGLESEMILPEQFIEKVGRTCYKSEDKITDDSAVKFVSNLIKRGHEAMIEHWNLIFKTNEKSYKEILSDWLMLQQNLDIFLEEPLRPYLRFTYCQLDPDKTRYVISGNMRAWRDFARACVEGTGRIPAYMHGIIRCYPLFFPEYQDYVPAIIINDILIPVSVFELTEAERQVHQTVTMKFTCDRGVSHEMVRHRVASFAQESTRYCNYGNAKFGSEITVIRPSWCPTGSALYDVWHDGCLSAEGSYFMLLAEDATPQEARSLLDTSTKTEIVVTMNLNDWEHFFHLRCDPAAHPDMQEVAIMARDLLEEELTVKPCLGDSNEQDDQLS